MQHANEGGGPCGTPVNHWLRAHAEASDQPNYRYQVVSDQLESSKIFSQIHIMSTYFITTEFNYLSSQLYH